MFHAVERALPETDVNIILNGKFPTDRSAVKDQEKDDRSSRVGIPGILGLLSAFF